MRSHFSEEESQKQVVLWIGFILAGQNLLLRESIFICSDVKK